MLSITRTVCFSSPSLDVRLRCCRGNPSGLVRPSACRPRSRARLRPRGRRACRPPGTPRERRRGSSRRPDRQRGRRNGTFRSQAMRRSSIASAPPSRRGKAARSSLAGDRAFEFEVAADEIAEVLAAEAPNGPFVFADDRGHTRLVVEKRHLAEVIPRLQRCQLLAGAAILPVHAHQAPPGPATLVPGASLLHLNVAEGARVQLIV